MGIKVQRTRCFLDIGISNVLGKTETSDAFTQLLRYYVVISQISVVQYESHTTNATNQCYRSDLQISFRCNYFRKALIKLQSHFSGSDLCCCCIILQGTM